MSPFFSFAYFHFYSRASCEARPVLFVGRIDCIQISTHAPRVRRDQKILADGLKIAISTHAPRVRRDMSFAVLPNRPTFISTHAPRVRRDIIGKLNVRSHIISTHAPRVRRDWLGRLADKFSNIFLLTRLV